MKTNELPYRLDINNRFTAVQLRPELNDLQWADIEKVGSEILSHLNAMRTPRLLVDLSQLNYMGSSQVALIVRLWKVVKEHDGRMVVVCRDPMVLEVLSLAGLTRVWTILPTREEGMAEFGGADGAASGSWPSAVLLVVGLLAVIGAIVGLLLLHNRRIDGTVGMALAFGLSAVALLAGIATAIMAAGGKRVVGVGLILLSVSVMVAGAFAVK